MPAGMPGSLSHPHNEVCQPMTWWEQTGTLLLTPGSLPRVVLPLQLTGPQSASWRSLMRLKPVVKILPSARKMARMGRAPSCARSFSCRTDRQTDNEVAGQTHHPFLSPQPSQTWSWLPP